MQVIRPNCRAHFTQADVEFLTSTAGAWVDESIDELLDSNALFTALLDRPACVRVSTHFYFYVLVRHVLLQSGLDDRTVADYVAEVLAEFSTAERARCPLADDPRPYEYVVDLLTAIRDADEQKRFILRAHVGNLSLFLAGVFSKHLEHRARTRAAPELAFYENVGVSSYLAASDHPLAKRYAVAPVFHALSESFHTARVALNDLSDRLIFLDGDSTAELIGERSEDGGRRTEG
ncbi:MAG: hypothetical protein V1929_05915 [bacterium]